MKNRTRLLVLAGSIATLAGFSRAETLSPCTDACYAALAQCFTSGVDDGICLTRYDRCRASCGSEAGSAEQR